MGMVWWKPPSVTSLLKVSYHLHKCFATAVHPAVKCPESILLIKANKSQALIAHQHRLPSVTGEYKVGFRQSLPREDQSLVMKKIFDVIVSRTGIAGEDSIKAILSQGFQ